MSTLEILAVVFSLISVILTVKESPWCWPIGILGIVFYSIIFYQQEMIGNFWLQSLFLGQSLLGIWNWKKPRSDFFVTWFDDKTFLFGLTGLAYIFCVLIIELNHGKMVYLDSATTVLSIFAMFLLAYKVIDGWIYWIVADILYILIFLNSGLYLSSFVYFIFLCCSLYGLIKWTKNTKIV